MRSAQGSGWMLAGLMAALTAASACAPDRTPLETRTLLRCDVEVAGVRNGVTEFVSQDVRFLWVDPTAQRYALSDLGSRLVDDEWAAAKSEEIDPADGLAPAAGGAGAFLCFERDKSGVCAEGVDLARLTYASTRPAQGAEPDVAALLRIRGGCTPAPDDGAWPAPSASPGEAPA